MKYIIGIIVCLLANLVYAQDQSWVRTFGGSDSEYARDILVCANGDILILGATSSDEANQSQFYLSRLDADLNCIWSKSIGDAGIDNAESIAESADGSIYAVGTFLNLANMSYDGRIYKLDSDGNQLWATSIENEGWDFLTEAACKSDGSLVVAGYHQGDYAVGTYFWIDTDGTVIDQYELAGDGDYKVSALAIDAYDNVYSTVNAVPNFSDLPLGIVIKMEEDPDFLYQASFFDGMGTFLYDIDVRNDSAVVCGAFLNDDETYAAKLIMLDSQLSTLWEDQQTVPDSYIMTGVTFSSSGLLFAGKTNSYGAGGMDIMIQHRDVYSNWLMGPTFGSPGEEDVTDVVYHPNGAVYFLGQTSYYGLGDQDLYVVKLQDDGITSFYNLDELFGQGCFNVSVGDAKPNDHSVIVHPDFLELKGWAINPSFVLYDVYGRMVSRGQNQATIPLEGLPSGYYLFVCDGYTERFYHSKN
jgi:hypothetical protein